MVQLLTYSSLLQLAKLQVSMNKNQIQSNSENIERDLLEQFVESVPQALGPWGTCKAIPLSDLCRPGSDI